MQINLTGDIVAIIEGLESLADQLDIQLHNEGYPIEVKQRAGPITISNNGGKGEIYFQEKIHFFRAIGLWIEQYQKIGEFSLSEQPQFQTSGVMLDVSRNAVLKVEEVQRLLRHMAIMGLNVAMLYTEDTYEIPDYPYFGYMRGRYTEEELRQCDEYADLFGIEMIPCIQTLGHLAMALKWGYAQEIRDTYDILLAGNPKTYQFIENMMAAASRPFKSKRIHVGMDEAHQLGLGHFLKQNGYKNRFDIMNQHLEEVVSIADRLGLSPMIWSDMYFRLGSKEGEYYDPDACIPKDAAESIPANVQLVYWDYYHDDEEFYRSFIKKHTELGRNTVFAGGAWTWNGIAPNYGRAFKTTESALSACKKEGIQEIFTTLWGDNGAETPLTAALPVMQLFAEHTYKKTVSMERIRERFLFCTGCYLDDFLLLNSLDETPGVMANNLYSSNASKFLLWQDVLIGLFDENIKGLEMNEHYKNLVPMLKAAKDRNPGASEIFGFYEQLAVLLSLKSEIGIQVKSAYDQGDKSAMAGLSGTIQKLINMAETLHALHRAIWFSLNKPFGWEIIELRYGGLAARLKTARFRIQQWLEGEINKIEELEETRLKHDGPNGIPEGSLGNHFYYRIVTAGSMN
ncbi:MULTISPECIES: beta-N-acetylhexosaminidase [Bacillus]|uniref:Beta-N-acetylhexosaminidase n=1 Tax=Bacillus infantis TaxID=324767 RepID=A0A5D4SKM8_9BACI|nr:MULTISPECIES: beta-N-acetylhexosaminidase [Bacillus]PLR74263.1 beta-N-acetylhexosaminidase [Bacillus sp. UMB0728]TYS63321.1 beta-N-acetylhexosaminidase [Bacillus infantis]